MAAAHQANQPTNPPKQPNSVIPAPPTHQPIATGPHHHNLPSHLLAAGAKLRVAAPHQAAQHQRLDAVGLRGRVVLGGRQAGEAGRVWLGGWAGLGERDVTLGSVDLKRDIYIKHDCSRGVVGRKHGRADGVRRAFQQGGSGAGQQGGRAAGQGRQRWRHFDG